MADRRYTDPRTGEVIDDPDIDGMVHPPYVHRGLLPDDNDQYLTGPDPRPGGVTPGRYRFTFEFEEA